MSWNTGAWNTGYFNTILVGNVTGLKLYKCVYWVEDLIHGGDISTNEVDVLFDYISYPENLNGNTDYRKCHLKNIGTEATGEKIIRIAFFGTGGLNDRVSFSIAAGLDYDDMTSKPEDELFSDGVAINLEPGEYQPFWIKRTITADAAPGYFINQPVYIVVSEV